jgi:hypothetical protein
MIGTFLRKNVPGLRKRDGWYRECPGSQVLTPCTTYKFPALADCRRAFTQAMQLQTPIGTAQNSGSCRTPCKMCSEARVRAPSTSRSRRGISVWPGRGGRKAHGAGVSSTYLPTPPAASKNRLRDSAVTFQIDASCFDLSCV